MSFFDDVVDNEPTLFGAFADYEEYVKRQHPAPKDGSAEERHLSEWGHQQIRNIARLKERHHDMPLSSLKFDGCQSLIDVWRNRPMVKGKDMPVAVRTARHHIKQLMMFYRWLHRTDLYDWRKPEDFDELNTKITESKREKSQRVTPIQVETYTVEELAMLNEYATPIERAFLLLGLNCGFKQAEIATLRMNEVYLCEKHPFANVIGFESRPDDSFVKRVRLKTGVYGEHLLWQLTVDAMRRAIERRKTQRVITKGDGTGQLIPLEHDSYLLLSESGHPYTKRTKSGNRNSLIPNRWNSLTRRVQKDHPDFRTLSHSKLRKTGGNLIRQKFGGEIMAIYLCHGRVVVTDDLAEVYSNRPFGRLFEALQWLEEHLQPMFDATPDDPFPPVRKKGGTNLSRRQLKIIRTMSRNGAPVAQIAQKANVSRMTVYRHRETLNGS